MKAFKALRVHPDAILTAAHANESSVFYYPIDLHNYFLNAYCKDSDLGETSKAVFGWVRKSTPKKKRARDFYQEVASRVLKQFLDKDASYQYDVECEDIDQLDGKVLMLQFSKRQ